MKRVVAISFALLAGAGMMAAQAVDQYRSQKFSPQAAQSHSNLVLGALRDGASAGCPVLFSAKQGWDGNLVAVAPGERSKNGFSQRIRLSLANGNVIAARVTVHGLTPKTRYVPAESGVEGPAQISRTLNVSFSNDSANGSAADLKLRGFTAVFSIDVDSITYADGSTWKSGEGQCRVVPDPIMDIAAR